MHNSDYVDIILNSLINMQHSVQGQLATKFLITYCGDFETLFYRDHITPVTGKVTKGLGIWPHNRHVPLSKMYIVGMLYILISA
jgi:hypothetical protein